MTATQSFRLTTVHSRLQRHLLNRIHVDGRTIIAVLVIARKLMLQDFEALDVQSLLGFGGLLLALGGLYWLISEGDRRRTPASHELPDAAEGRKS
jgi:uncharacterized membrane protein (DUF373 family)